MITNKTCELFCGFVCDYFELKKESLRNIFTLFGLFNCFRDFEYKVTLFVYRNMS